MVRKLALAYSGDAEKLAAAAKSAQSGRKGLRYGCPATVLDAAQLAKQCWDGMLPSGIANCFRHAHCLPDAAEKELPQSSAQRDPTQEVVELQEV